ncbi:hypothetical protein HC362_14715 [Streptomyces sp. 891-h]|nr:hypothetical protein HC362_14715 [Streptomyces sp. 891-h]
MVSLWQRHGSLRPVPEPLPTPVVWAGAFAGSLVVVAVLRATVGLGSPLVALTTFGVLTTVLGLSGRAGAAPGTAGLCWLFHNSFAVAPQGELSWNGSMEVARLGLFLGLSLLGTSVARAADAAGAYQRLTTQAAVRGSASDPGKPALE